MKTKKILTTLVILIISIFTFFGCARVDMFRIIDGNFVITDKITIEFDEDKLNAHGVTLEEIKSKLDGEFEILEKCLSEWKNSFELTYPNLYIELTEGIICGKENDSENNHVKNEYSIYITFANSKMFYLFYGYFDDGENEISGALQDVGPFLNKIANEEYSIENLGWFLYKYSMITSENPISNIKEFTYDGRNICEDYEQFTGYSIDDVELNQIFVYPDDRLYSNADYSDEYYGISRYYWELSNKEDGFELELFHLFPRAVAWYVLGLILSAIVVIALIVVYIKKYRKQVEDKVTKEDVENE